MADRHLYRRRGDMILPANQESLEYVRTLPLDQDMGGEFIRLRNDKLHRKAFVLVKMSFDYWQPKSFLRNVEVQTVKRLHQFLSKNGIDRESSKTLCSQFLNELNAARAGLECQRNIDAFREEVTIEAGFYTLEIGPSGPRKKAKSWAYKNMGQDEFERLYIGVRDACWRLVLNQQFESIEAAEEVAEQMLEFY